MLRSTFGTVTLKEYEFPLRRPFLVGHSRAKTFVDSFSVQIAVSKPARNPPR
jgi:hypothetical protein